LRVWTSNNTGKVSEQGDMPSDAEPAGGVLVAAQTGLEDLDRDGPVIVAGVDRTPHLTHPTATEQRL